MTKQVNREIREWLEAEAAGRADEADRRFRTVGRVLAPTATRLMPMATSCMEPSTASIHTCHGTSAAAPPTMRTLAATAARTHRFE